MTRVLVIDDDVLVRATFVDGLVRAGFDVAAAASGKEALGSLGESSFDVVVTDILMPEMDGIETIREIRMRHPAIAIVAVSGGGRIDAIQLLDFARELGADRIIAKPVHLADLVATVRDVAAAGSLSRGTSAGP